MAGQATKMVNLKRLVAACNLQVFLVPFTHRFSLICKLADFEDLTKIRSLSFPVPILAMVRGMHTVFLHLSSPNVEYCKI